MASLPLVLLTSLMIMSVAELRDGVAGGMICNSCNSSCSSRRRLQELPIKGRRPVVLRKEASTNANHELRLQNTSSLISTADLVVAQDGSGDYKTITEALTASKGMKRINSTKHFVIHVKHGIYDEIVDINGAMTNLTLVGDGNDLTVVTGNRSAHKGFKTFQSATFAVTGDGFMAQDITFENTAGALEEQAVALRSGSNLSVFYRCSFKGYQDTLYAHSGRQFYRECDIYGTIDFIFGDATAVFQNCTILVRRPLPQQVNTVTAQGRTDSNQITGFSFLSSRVMAAPDFKPYQSSIKTYLGRPWQDYSRTVFMKCILEELIDPSGWLQWNAEVARLNTLYYAEYMNTGAGAETSGRVTWPSFHVITNASEADKFTVENFLNGNLWLPATGVPFTPGI